MRNPFFTKDQHALLLGNEAIAAGALDAGIGMVSCYPGTPSSEVADTFALIRAKDKSGTDFFLEYSVNEKTAMEIAAGAALAGMKSLAAMKHVGLNVAADPLFTAAYIGLPGGLVVLSADDPGCHSSQNEQDNRGYARLAHLPCLEPATAQEAYEMTRAAFGMARKLEQPVMLRTTTRISHLRGKVGRTSDPETPETLEFERNPGRFVPVPAVAIKRHKILGEQMDLAREIAEKSPFNKISSPDMHTGYGVIASGVARNYLADALQDGSGVAVLELGMTWPLPEKMLLAFLSACKSVLTLEEGEPFLEKDIRALAQKNSLETQIEGKDKELGVCGEYSTTLVARRLARFMGAEEPKASHAAARDDLPKRPPNLCPGCAHRSVYYAVREAFGDSALYSSDIGCYTLGLLPPLKCADFLVCMGSSASSGSGFARASGKMVVGFIGDSTFFHSGITGLANAVYNRHNLLLVILDNGTTAMTGHQPNPGMDQIQLGENASRLNIETIVRGLGVEHLAKVNGHNIRALRKALAELGPRTGARVLIAEEPCMLYARRKLKKGRKAVAFVAKQGEAAEACARNLACPAFCRNDGNLAVNEDLCAGCMVCAQIAPGVFKARAVDKGNAGKKLN